MRRTIAAAIAWTAACAAPAAAQHVHTEGMAHAAAAPAPLPTLPGQAAYGAIAEVVGMLQADSTTDWSRVNLEALRQHLIDMDEVTMHSAVRQEPVDGGARMEITGAGRTRDAIRGMVAAHTTELNRMPGLEASYEPLPAGVRLTVLARARADSATVRRIRGLGFIGLLTVGAHHPAHHLALARGEPMAGHEH